MLEIGVGCQVIATDTATIAGEQIPVRGSQESGIANAAEKVSRTKPLQQFDIEQTQPGARRAIGNIATDIKNTAGGRAPALDAQLVLSKSRLISATLRTRFGITLARCLTSWTN